MGIQASDLLAHVSHKEVTDPAGWIHYDDFHLNRLPRFHFLRGFGTQIQISC